VAEIGTGLTFVTSSPGYNGKVVIGDEDGHVYAYDWASNTLAWTFTNPWAWGFDASPATWPGLNYVYIVDPAGHVFYLDPDDGTAKNIVQTGIEPGGGAGVPGAIPGIRSRTVKLGSLQRRDLRHKCYRRAQRLVSGLS
jgi:outer membrane protein assembly factor BamB